MAIRWDWRQEGFLAPPKMVIANGGERLYRAWSDPMKINGNCSRIGVCFSRHRAKTRSEAERFYSIAEWGDGFWRLVIFEVPLGTPMWVGRVHPDEYCAASLRGVRSQVFIQNPYAMALVPIDVVPLLDDLSGLWVRTSGAEVGDPAPAEQWDQVWDD